MREELETKLSSLLEDIRTVLNKKIPTEKKDIDWWGRGKDIVQWIALLFIPLILAVIGYLVDKNLQTMQSRSKMTELSLSILAEDPKNTDEDKLLRSWAVDLIQKYSGVEIPKSLRTEFENKSFSPTTERKYRPVAKTATELDTTRSMRTQESAFGNLATDALRIAFNESDDNAFANIAIMTSGHIRGNRRYDPGTVITLNDLRNEMPFNLKVSLYSITGTQLKAALEQMINSGEFPQVSGINFYYHKNSSDIAIIDSLYVGSSQFIEEASYNIVIDDFLQSRKEYFKDLRRVDDFSNGRNALDIIMLYLYSEAEVAPKIERRINLLSEKEGLECAETNRQLKNIKR